MAILVAHHEPTIAQTIATILRGVGYAVHDPFSDDYDALALLNREQEFNLIILSGALHATLLAARENNQPILIITGGNRYTLREAGPLDGVISGWYQDLPVLETPFKPQNLINVVDRYRRYTHTTIARIASSPTR